MHPAPPKRSLGFLPWLLLPLALVLGLALGGGGGFLAGKHSDAERLDDCNIAVNESADYVAVLADGVSVLVEDDSNYVGMQSSVDDLKHLTAKWNDDYDAESFEELLNRCADGGEVNPSGKKDS